MTYNKDGEPATGLQFAAVITNVRFDVPLF
jgi:hypothetical protein